MDCGDRPGDAACRDRLALFLLISAFTRQRLGLVPRSLGRLHVRHSFAHGRLAASRALPVFPVCGKPNPVAAVDGTALGYLLIAKSLQVFGGVAVQQHLAIANQKLLNGLNRLLSDPALK